MPPLPLEIVELIISFVTSIETRYNIFDAFPELREFISKTTTVLQYPLKNEVLQWVQVQEFPITSLIINDPTENGDIWLGRSSRCVCPNKKRPRWMTCHECCRIDKLDFVKEKIEKVTLHSWLDDMALHLQMFPNLKTIKLMNCKDRYFEFGGSFPELTNLHVEESFEKMLKLTIFDTGWPVDGLLGGGKGLYYGCPKLAYINNVPLLPCMIGADRVDPHTWLTKLRAIILLQYGREKRANKLEVIEFIEKILVMIIENIVY